MEKMEEGVNSEMSLESRASQEPREEGAEGNA